MSLDLPEQCAQDLRITKKDLLSNDAVALTAADKKAIRENVERVTWKFALTPDTTGVRPFRTEERVYEGIAIVEVVLRGERRADAIADRVAKILHRVVAHPSVVVLTFNECVTASVAEKRLSQSERGKTVTSEALRTPWMPTAEGNLDTAFLKSLSLASLAQTDMHALYADLRRMVSARAAAAQTGVWAPDRDASSIQCDLDDCHRIDREIQAARAAIRRSNSFSEKAELNAEVKKLELRRTAVLAQLGGKRA